MKIAIVAPRPAPYMVGGAEKLRWGLATHFNEFDTECDRESHQAPWLAALADRRVESDETVSIAGGNP